MAKDDDLKKNGSGYYDPTAYIAMKHVMNKTSREESARFKKLLSTLFYICDMAGYEIQGRISLKDKRTGKIWK